MDDQEIPSGARWPRRRRWVLLGCLATLVLTGVAYGLRGLWLVPWVTERVARYALEELGAELAIEGISGSGFGDLNLEGVRWRSDRPPLRALEEGRIELRFSLLGAIRGEPELELRVQGNGIEIELGGEATPSEGESALPELPRLELDLTRISVTQGGGAPLQIESLRVKGGLRDMRVRLEVLELSADPNHLSIREAWIDLEKPDWLAMARTFRGELDARLPDARVIGGLLGRELPIPSAELHLSIANGRADIVGSAELDGGSLQIETGRLALPEDDDLSQLHVELGGQARFDDLAPLGSLFGLAMQGSWGGSIDISGPVAGPTGRAVGHGEGLRIGGLSLGEVEIDVQTDGRSARFEHCEISGPGLVAVLRGGVQFEPLELLDVSMNISADRRALAEVLPVPCEHAFFHGRLDGPPSAPRGSFEASATGLDPGGYPIDDIEVRGRVEGRHLDVDELRFTKQESFVEAAGAIEWLEDGVTAELAKLGLTWRGASVEIQPGARLAYAPGRFSIEGLELSSDSAGESGRASITLKHEEGKTRGDLEFHEYDAGPLLAPFLPEGLEAGRATGKIAGEIGGEAPAFTVDLSLRGWRVGSQWPELNPVLRGSFDGHELALEQFVLGFEDEEAARLEGRLRIPFAPERPAELLAGPIELRLECATTDGARSLDRFGIEAGISATGPCRLALDLGGEWSALTGSLAVTAANVTLGTGSRARSCDLAAQIRIGERIRIEQALFSSRSGSMALSGEIEAAADVPHWLAEPQALLDIPLALEAKVDLVDVGWIAGLLSELRRISGQVAGRVQITGTARQPAFSGKFECTEAELRLASGAAPLRNLGARVSIEGSVVHIEELVGEIGGAPIHVRGTVEPFGPFPRMDLELDGQNILLARDARLRLRADANLLVKGTPSQLAIRGKVLLVEGSYKGEISPLEELVRAGRGGRVATSKRIELFADGPLADASLDIHVTGPRTFDYQTNLLKVSFRPDAWLRGTGKFPVLEGPVYIEEGSVILPSGTMELASGLLTFRRDAPFRPEITLKAESRIQRHDVRAVATGSVEDLEIVLSSSPPLADDDCWILVLTGQLPPTRGENRSQQAMEALAIFLARDSLVRWFGSGEADAASLIDRFEIDVGAQTSQSGQPTGRVLFYLRPRNPRSGRATYMSAELDEYDRANYALGIVFRPR